MTLEERLEKYLAKDPQIDPTAYVSKHAVLVGDVRIGANASVWPGCVLRADINSIELGEGSNLQDGTMVHLADDAGVKIGKNTTVGHGAIIHACEIGNECLIGMGAIVLDKRRHRRQLHRWSGGACQKNTWIPAGSLVSFARQILKQLEDKRRRARYWSKKYSHLAGATSFKERSRNKEIRFRKISALETYPAVLSGIPTRLKKT